MKVLITGVNGLIGGAVFRQLSQEGEAFEVFGLDRSSKPSHRVASKRDDLIASDHFFEADLTDFAAIQEACNGMDVVVHLAANPEPNAPWDDLLKSNIMGTYNVFEACRQAGVRRVVYASSGQATLGYMRVEPYKALAEGRIDDVPDTFRKVDHTMPTRALNPYGCTKIWGEALARSFADSHGLSFLCIRFGWVVDQDALPYPQGKDVWCSCRDAVQMVTRCITAPDDVRFDIFHAFSNCEFLWSDLEHAKDVVGYEPQDHISQFEK